MPHVKLDCRILDSTVWFQRDLRDMFVTALLMAIPDVRDAPTPQLDVRTMQPTGFKAPPGWYGYVGASGEGIAHRALVHDRERWEAALIALGTPEPESRSKAHDGRRMIRVDGGYLILNFDTYRARDNTAADRQRRHRERVKGGYIEPHIAPQAPPNDESAHRKRLKGMRKNGHAVTSRNVTKAEAEAIKATPLPPKGKGSKAGRLTWEQVKEACPLGYESRTAAEAWEAYCDHRAAKRAPITNAALELLKLKLKSLPDPVGSLRQSVEMGWTGLFPLGGNGPGRSQDARTAAKPAARSGPSPSKPPESPEENSTKHAAHLAALGQTTLATVKPARNAPLRHDHNAVTPLAPSRPSEPDEPHPADVVA